RTSMDKEEDLEILGEQLYSLIYPKHKEGAAKLTGMLLELPAAVLSQMLQDEAMLTAAVEKALRALQLAPKVAQKDEDDVSESSDSLGEQLFELVDVYNTGHSQKITGMLLEQPKDVVLQLLSDPKLLEEHVNLHAPCCESLHRALMCSHKDIHIIFLGMLLEMDAASLQQLLSDHRKLQVAVQKAQAVLDTES
uniref:PABC domain-containing protein n=1 Tax=Xiphophorus couchianus TaxID=32473 RepID=A0A3B5KTU1_9TELE